MNQLALIGGTIITPLEERFTDLIVDDGVVQRVGPLDSSATNVEKLDVSGCYVTPGLIDLQLNGGPDCNFWGDPTIEDLAALCRQLVNSGVTTFLPTLITADVKHIRKNVEFLQSIGVGSTGIGQMFGVVKGCSARLPGVHLEGPCLSPQRPGVHPLEWIKPLTKALVEQLSAPSVRMITVAPESDPTDESLKLLYAKGVIVSLGHSNASFEEAQLAFDRGVRMMTHTYNALPPIHHRAPGAVTAALLDDRVTCCVICDGLHVDVPAIKLLLKAKGVDKVILVTDAAQIGTTGGGLVGSSIDLNQAVKNVVEWKVASFTDAIRMASFNPAQAMGWSDKLGEIVPGKCADLVVWDKATLAIKHVFVSGLKVGRS